MRTILSTLIKSLILLLLIVILPISCSKDITDDDNIIIPGEDNEVFIKVATELYDYLFSHEDATIEDIQEQLKQYSSQVASDVNDDILYLKIDSLYDFICDPYKKIGAIDMDETEIDDNGYSKEDVYDEIKKALYPEQYLSHSRISDIIDSTSLKGYTRANDDSPITLNKKKILIWDPWGLSNIGNELNNIKTTEGEKVEVEFSSSEKKIREFDQYDIVYMCCHGLRATDRDECVGIVMPRSIWERAWNLLSGKGEETQKEYFLRESELEQLFPRDLSKTILWTSVCYADAEASVIKKIATNRHVAAFAGVNTRSISSVTRLPFKKFVEYFYQGSTASVAAKRAIPQSIIENTIPESKSKQDSDAPYHMNYINCTSKKFPNERFSGRFSFYPYLSVQGPQSNQARSSVNNQPRTEIIVSNEMYNYLTNRTATRNTDFTRALRGSNTSGGFWIRNKDTGHISEIEINDQTAIMYNKTTYYPNKNGEQKMLVRFEVLGKTDNLEVGTYEYRTYLEIDGEKEYSDSIYEFTVSEIKHLTCPDFYHPHMIDLGLPSGRKWSCCNLGAIRIVDSGISCAWGITEQFKFGDDLLGEKARHKYQYSEYHGDGAIDEDVYTDIGSNISGTAYDAATNYNGALRMPTKKDVEELIENCTFLWGHVYKTDGIKTVSKSRGSIAIGQNGNMIFLNDIFWTSTLSSEESDEQPFLMKPRKNGVSGCAYCFYGVDYKDSSYPLEKEVQLLLHYIENDEKDDNIYYFEGEMFYKPTIIPEKRFWQCTIRPVSN